MTTPTNVVSVDKAYEIEFGNAKDEIRMRMEFNRRLLNLQITLIGGIIGLFAANQSTKLLTPYIEQVACGVIIWMAVVFAMENFLNNFHIIQAARFQHTVLNSKYQLAIKRPVYEWEIFLAVERHISAPGINGSVFFGDSAFVLNLIIALLSIVGYVEALRLDRMDFQFVSLPAFVLMFTGFVAIVTSYWHHFQRLGLLKDLVTKDEAVEFSKTHSL